MTNFKRGVQVHIYGQKRVSDGNIGSLQWPVDKGTVNGKLSNTYNVLQTPYTAFNTARLTLYLAADAPVHTGDKFVIDGTDYYGDGDIVSWKVYKVNKLHHYEIPLKAKP